MNFNMPAPLSQHGLSLQQATCSIRDRLSWLLFCDFAPGDAVAHANTLWAFCKVLIAAKVLDGLSSGLDRGISAG